MIYKDDHGIDKTKWVESKKMLSLWDHFNERIMLAKDLIATVVKTFFEELDDVRDGGGKESREASYAKIYESYFKRDRSWFLQADVQEITTFFADDPIYKLEMLTELLYRDARRLTDAEIQAVMYRKIIELYDIIDNRTQEFSVERMNRVAEMKEWLENEGGKE